MSNNLLLQENVLLARMTTLKIGGPARYFVLAEYEEAVVGALKFADSRRLPVFVLGGGSNVLIADEGFDGLVVQVALKGVSLDGEGSQTNSVRLTVGAGEDWDEFVAKCVERELAGVECLSGIPGFVGGTPVQNVGAYGQEVSETIVAVRCLDTKLSEIVTLSNAECGFTYRKSIFNSTERGRYVVLAVTFELVTGGAPKVVYKDIVEYFDGRSPSLAEVRNAVLEIRRSKSMVIDVKDPNAKSAGSFFKNPVVSPETFHEVSRSFDHVPHFDLAGMIKIPAAWLIENAGFYKGFALGNAGISTNHTLALVNRGGATAREMIELMRRIQTVVTDEFGIRLEPEPVFVGFPDDRKITEHGAS